MTLSILAPKEHTMRPVEPQKRAEIISLFAEGLSRNAIARRAGVAGATVSKICADEGLAFDRSKTALAVRAHQIDLAEARVLLAKKIAVRADELLEDMDAPMFVHNFGGRENTYVEELIDSPTVEARQRMMTAVGIGFDKITRIVERSNDGVEQARGVLDDLAEGFRLAADQMRATDATPQDLP